MPDDGETADSKPVISMYACDLTEEDLEAAIGVLRSGYLVQGPAVEAFEQGFSDLFGTRHSVACSSGTAALRMALQTQLTPGGEVLVPALTFIATASSVIEAGGIPVPCDIDPDTWLIDLNDAAKRISSRTEVILPVHLFGNPCNRGDVERFASAHDLTIVWDAAQAHGAKLDGVDVASWSALCCHSFYATKNLHTGEGGMVSTNNAAEADRLRRARNHGQNELGEWVERGANFRMTDIQGAIGLARLERFEEMARRRSENANHYLKRLSSIPGIQTQLLLPGSTHAWHQFAIRVRPELYGSTRDMLAARLSDEFIETAVYYRRPIHDQPYFKENFGAYDLPVAETLTTQLLSLPIHDQMEPTQLDRIADIIEVVHHESHSSCHEERLLCR